MKEGKGKNSKQVTKDSEQKPLIATQPHQENQEDRIRKADANCEVVYLVLVAIVLRVGFVIINELLNIHTDVDYHVYTEAAQEMLKKDGNPYYRFTFRYSPILAYLMIPNLYVHPAFGKLLFCAFDVLAIVYMIAFFRRIPGLEPKVFTFATSFWVFNPLMILINGRGSCESLTLFLLCGMLYHLKAAMDRSAKAFNLCVSAVFYGLLVHLRLYPILFVATLWILLNKERLLPRWEILLYGLISGGLNIALIGLFYLRFGAIFLEECFLYHLRRKDPRHNFSLVWITTVYNYFLEPTEAFLPQAGLYLLLVRLALILAVAITFRKLWLHSLFIQTFVFTTLNTVYTAQYAIWEIQLLPYVLLNSRITARVHSYRDYKVGFFLLLALWLVGLLGWDVFSHKFEHQGQNSLYWMHFANISYFAIRLVVLHYIIENKEIRHVI